jgi:hypothetical protein
MTIEVEAGASYLQCSTRPTSAHLFLTAWIDLAPASALARSLGGIHGCALSTGFSKVLRS